MEHISNYEAIQTLRDRIFKEIQQTAQAIQTITETLEEAKDEEHENHLKEVFQEQRVELTEKLYRLSVQNKNLMELDEDLTFDSGA